MKLSNTSEYAIRILGFMARDSSQLYSAKYLVEKLGISDKYLRRIMTDLSKAGFINSKQGRDGGYSFAKPIEDIYLYDIIDSVEGIEKYKRCLLGFDDCSDENPCAIHSKWGEIRKNIFKVFETTNLKEIADSGNTRF